MKSVDIALGARSYQVRIGRDLLHATDEFAPWIGGRQVCIVSDDIVAPLYLQQVRDALDDGAREIIEHIVPNGERSKSLSVAEGVFEALLAARCDREVTIVALGGGVVGDIAGFVAACYQRGVAFIQAPTTLLAQVDSSVGGKTGVNHALGKNMIGAFHQPRRVLADTAALDTLARREFAAGMAEVIKYAIIDDAEFFDWLEDHIDAVIARDSDVLETMIERCCVSKARIVAADERESGARALLNLGHTFGHAIETATNYERYLHGEAVAIGIAMAAHLSTRMQWMAPAQVVRINNLLDACALPNAPFGGVDAQRMLTLMQSDKKSRGGKLRLVIPRDIGNTEIVADYPRDALAATVAHFTESPDSIVA